MPTVTADKVVVELSVLLDKYQADVKSARSNFEQAMSATQISAANAEKSIETAANKIAASTVGIGSEAKRTAAIVEQSNAAMGDSATATAAVIARATELQTAEFAKQAAASAKAAAAIQESSAAIKSGLLAGAAPVAGLFAVSEIVKLTDEYIKFQNSLRATGLAGADLAAVQERLFAVAEKYGTPLTGLSELYSRAAIAGRELGLTQDQLIQLSEGVAASFKVAGTGASQQKGALTQLSEALGEPIIRARQFNSLLTDAPPIIQAVARGLDAAGGSVGKLGALVRSGGVTNAEFFAAFLKGSQSTIQQADKFQLTFSAAFTTLENALSKYIGETNESISVSERFAIGIQSIANNLDTIIPALGVIAATYGTMKVASLVAGSVAVQAARDVAVATTEQTTAIVDGRAAAAIAAKAEADAIRAIVAEIELEVAARRELAATLALNGAAEAEIAAADRAVIVAQRDLIVAEGEAAAAIAVETAAVTEAGIAARLAAAGTALFSGALAALGGPVIAPIVIVVGALTAAILAFRGEQSAAEKQTRDLAAQIDSNDRYLKSMKASADGAAASVKGVGSAAGTATAPIGAFAGAVGTAADNLHRLAAARRADALAAADAQIAATRTQIAGVSQRIADSAPSGVTLSKVGIVPSAARDADQSKLATLQAQLTALQAARSAQAAVPLENRLTDADRAGGRNLPAELQGLEAQHTAAVKAGNKTAAEQIEEQINIRKLTTKYMKDGLDNEQAVAAATADAAKIRAGEQTGDTNKASAKGARDAAAAQRKADEAAAKRDANAKAYADEVDRLDKEYLDAQRSKTLSAQQEADRAKAEVAAELRRQIDDANAKTKGKNATLTPAQASNEIALATRNAAARNAVIDDNLREKQAQDAFAVADQQLKIRQDATQLDASLALTAKDRRDAELKILDLQLQEIALRTAAIVASTQTTEAQKNEARATLKAAQDAQPAKREQVLRSTDSPGQSYTRDITRTGGQINEAVQGVAVNGLKALDDGLTDAIVHFKSLGDVAKSTLDTIVAGIIRIGLEQAIIGPIGKFLFGSASGGGLLASILPGRASGGDVQGGQMYVVGENGPELFRAPTSGSITPNRALASAGGGGNTTVVQPHNYDLRGAVVTADLLAQMDAKANDAAVRGATGGAVMAGRNAMTARRRSLT